MKTTGLCIILLLAGAAVLLAGCTGPQAQPAGQTGPVTMAAPVATASSDTIQVAGTSIGDVLVDSAGKTLYYFANDIPGSGESACSVQCTTNWPVFSAGTILVSPPLRSEDFGTITRADGSSQTTYNGWPLYYYRADMNPGDMKGESALNVWYAMKPNEAVMIAHTPALGSYLTDKSGKALYVFANDAPESTTCSGACLTKWPPFNAATITAPSVLKVSDFSAARRTDGIMQTAYKDRLLYYYTGDMKSGDANGQGFNGVWYVANITGTIPPVPTPVPTKVPTPVPTFDYSSSDGSGGGGY
jgi:predicted lipoprotein with Yx(FWY)xxD motif